MSVSQAHGDLRPTWGGYVNDQYEVSEKKDNALLDPEIDSVYASIDFHFIEDYFVAGY